MQQITIAGRLGSDATLRTAGTDNVTSFNVAVDGRKGREKVTSWYRVSLWGKRGEALQPYLLKGVSVTVAGEFSLDEYEGKPQLNIRANEIALQGGRNGGEQSRGNGGNNAPRNESPSGDGFDEDEIPFMTSAGMF